MSIVTELKKQIVRKGYSADGVNTISKGIARLTEIETDVSPLEALVIDTTIGAETDLLGKVVSDLQENIVITDTAITGNLKYVTDYTGFSGKESEQSGNYFAFHCPMATQTGVTVNVVTPSGKKWVVDPSDGLIVLRMTSTNKPLKITASKDGYVDFTKEYDLSGLTRSSAS